MIEKIIEFSAKNRFLILGIVLVLIGFSVHTLKQIPLDAIPDLSDTQVIIYSKWDRAPDIMEDQVTYPIISTLLGTPHVKAIRGFSDFGYSYVYVIFEDGTDMYWARSRVSEFLSRIGSSLPAGVKTELGPNATGLGWVYQYALVDKSGTHSLQELRSLQDWNLRTQLQSVQGVAEVASIGGYIKRYQIAINPQKLVDYNLPLTKVIEAIRSGNNESGGGLLEFNGREYMLRAHGYARSVEDFESIAVGVDMNTAKPILIKDLGTVSIASDLRRGLTDLDGQGDTVSGIVIMQNGENALNVIKRVKQRLDEIKPGLPEGVEIIPVYDRSDLIQRAIDTLKHTLLDEIIIVSLVILIFLWHIPSAIVPIITIPVSVLISFIPFMLMGLTINIMSLAGIAISIGVLVDGAIVEVENAYKRLEEWIADGRKGDFHEVRLKALKEVGPSVFFSLLVIAVSFVPIFTLVDQEGRLFKPLAYSKNMAMAIAAVLAITLDPALRMMFTRMTPYKNKIFNTLLVGNYYPEEKHPISRILFSFYEPVCRFVLRYRKATLGGALLLLISAIPVYLSLGHEFMPPLNEGSILYMPTTLPGISASEAQKSIQMQDKILKSFPEVDRVFGKIGRAETSTDPAPLSMAETTVMLKSKSEWRPGMTYEKLIDEMDAQLQIPGWKNAWTMPIKNRVDMLSTGIRTPIGIKVFGNDFKTIESIGRELEQIVSQIKGTRSVFAERVSGGYFVDFDLKRDQLARYAVSIEEAQMMIASAIGGENLTTTIEGRERYPVSLRYAREQRADIDEINNLIVTTDSGAQILLKNIADIKISTGPSMIRDEDGMLTGYVYVDISGRDIGGYVEEAKKIVGDKLKLPAGYSLRWSGQYENMLRVRERLKVILPLTLLLIFFLLYLNTKSAFKAGLVMLAVPFSLIGAVWLLWFLDYNISIAVWVGMIALMGLDAETGVFMLLFLDLSYDDYKKKGLLKTKEDLTEAIVHGAVKRVRPKMMTVCAAFIGLLPIMWSMGTGSDVMKRIAAPMVGGLVSSFILELLIYPVLFALWKERESKLA